MSKTKSLTPGVEAPTHQPAGHHHRPRSDDDGGGQRAISVADRFTAAFPWFDHHRWAWHYEPVSEGGSAYRIPGARPDARGEIAIYMPGAGDERFLAVQRWLVAQFNPAYEVPATRYVDAELIGHRAGRHNSEWRGGE